MIFGKIFPETVYFLSNWIYLPHLYKYWQGQSATKQKDQNQSVSFWERVDFINTDNEQQAIIILSGFWPEKTLSIYTLFDDLIEILL